MTGGDSTKIYLQTYSEDKICHEVASLESPQNNASVVQSCPEWSHEHYPGTLQGTKTMKDTSIIGITRGDNPPEDEDKYISSPRKKQPIDNHARASNALNSEGKTGSEDGRIADYSPCKPEVASNLEKVEAEHESSNKGSLQEHIEKDIEANNNQYLAKDETLIYDAPVFNEWNCPEDLADTTKFKDGKHTQSEDIPSEDCYNGLTSYFTCLHPLAEKCRRTSDLKDCKYPVCQEEKTPLVGSPLSENVNPLDKCKGKEKVSSTERKRTVSKEKDDSNGSVKSSNSTQPFVTGKRAWNPGEEIFIGSKRKKKSSDENSCSGPRVKEDSSFVNWISNVTKGFFRSGHVEKHSLALVPNSMPNKQRGLFSASKLNDSDSFTAPRTVGFGSILKAVYWPRLTAKSNNIVNADHLGEPANSKELQLEDLTNGRNSNRVNHDNDGIMLHKPVPISSVRIDQGVCQFGEPFPVVANISGISSHIQERVKDNMGSSSSSPHNGVSSPSEAKETSKIGPCLLNKSSNMSIMNKVGGIPGSVWIARFSPRVAAQMEFTNQCNQGTPLEPEKCIDECNMLLHHSRNDRDHVKDHQHSGGCHHSPLEDQKPTSEDSPQYSISPMGLACSKKVHTDPKTKSNLNPILPSQKIKKLEPMTSVFAKRLDAFRHIQTLEVADDMTPENATCLFCGKNGHIITSCSDVTESELEDLLKNTSSLGGAEKSTCLCIRCFQHTHWAVACPYASLCGYQHLHGNASIINYESFSRTKGRSDAPSLSNHGVKLCKKSKDQQHQVLSSDRIHHGEMSTNVTEFMFQPNIVDKKGAMKGKQIASTPGEAELGDKSHAHFHNLVIKKNIQERIFERIRKLRLSRTDVIRWMESSICHFSLEGFFLRVRLGKCEEGQGGTCYHVACISGAYEEKIHGGSKNRLPVYIGGSKCWIDCHFISNHDFVEDELNAWWSMTLQRGGHPPSEADLDKKLRERAMLDH